MVMIYLATWSPRPARTICRKSLAWISSGGFITTNMEKYENYHYGNDLPSNMIS